MATKWYSPKYTNSKTIFTTTSTIKLIQVNSEKPQYTPPTRCTVKYITVPTELTSIVTLSGVYTATNSPFFRIPDGLHECVHPDLNLQYQSRFGFHPADDEPEPIKDAVCPRHYTYAALYPEWTTINSYPRSARYNPASPTPTESMAYQNRNSILGFCCPYSEYTTSGTLTTATWSLIEPTDPVPKYHALNYCQTITNSTTTHALPVVVLFAPSKLPLASSYDPIASNMEYMFYTSWPLSRTNDPTRTPYDQIFTGLTIATVTPLGSDPSPLDSHLATTYPKEPFEFTKAQLSGLIAGCFFFAIILVTMLVWFFRCRGPKNADRRARWKQTWKDNRPRRPAPWTPPVVHDPNSWAVRSARINAGVTRPAEVVAVNRTETGMDPPPIYKPRAGTGEVELESMPTGSYLSVGDASRAWGSSDALNPSGGTSGQSTPGLGERSPTYPGPPVGLMLEVPAERAPAYTVLRD